MNHSRAEQNQKRFSDIDETLFIISFKKGDPMYFEEKLLFFFSEENTTSIFKSGGILGSKNISEIY